MSERALALRSQSATGFRLACPRCKRPFPSGVDAARCSACELRFARDGGVWHLLPPERELALRRFVGEYREVRRREGWGSGGPAYYRALPFRDLTGRFERIWRIRAAGFRALIRRVVRPLEAERGRPLAILDLGAGNGWLSHRLAQRGHRVAAVDLSDDPRDGLGAYVHYGTAFTPVQADFDHLPFAEAEADLVVFNASLHYSPDCGATLAEALRVLRGGGRLVVMDTPFYRSAESGARMVDEQHAAFLAAHGFPSDAGGGAGFLTFRRAATLLAALHLRLRIVRPSSYWPMAAASLAGRLAGRRETSVFPLVVGARP